MFGNGLEKSEKILICSLVKPSQATRTHTKQISHCIASLLLPFDVHLLWKCLQISPGMFRPFDGEFSSSRFYLGGAEVISSIYVQLIPNIAHYKQFVQKNSPCNKRNGIAV